MSNQASSRAIKLPIETVETVEVRFGGFEGLPAEKGIDFVKSPEFTCFGHQWCLILWPGGWSDSDDGQVALYLDHMSGGVIKVDVDLIVKDPGLEVKRHLQIKEREYGPWRSGESCWGRHNLAERSAIIDSLQNGVLVIQVQMRQIKPSLLPAYLENPLGKMILKKFMDEESADVVFEVSSKNDMAEENQSSTFHAHRLILQDTAPYLFNLCTSGDGSTAIPITDVKPEIFRHLLYYIYGGKVSEEDLKTNAMEIITAADKYEVVGLKLEAEAILVSSTTITLENVMDILLFADQKNCALLKEAAIDFLVTKKSEVASKVSFDDVPGRLMKDVFVAFNNDESVRVSTLREKLHAKGLEVDGSREAMIARLEENP